MRSPVEVWIKEHREAVEHADRIAELLAPCGILTTLLAPEGESFRLRLAEHLEQLALFSSGHFRREEQLLVPSIAKHLDTSNPSLSGPLGCLAREHHQMHRFVESLVELLPALRSATLNESTASDLLGIAFGIQSLVRYHCSKEERDIYPLVDMLPQSETAMIMGQLNADDLPIKHLIKPLGKDTRIVPTEPVEGPDN
jgi:hypothetical protein